MANLKKGLLNKDSVNKWYSNYHKLKVFSMKPQPTIGPIDEELSQWAQIQWRMKYKLPCELKEKLLALNFDFGNCTKSWDSMYGQLANFSQMNGHTYLPTDQKYEELNDWLVKQILNKRFLSKDQFQRLDSLNIDWDIPISRDHRWEQMFMRLNDFYDTFGHCRVPQNWPKDKQLAFWVKTQRKKYSLNKLHEDRKLKLERLNFVWHIQDEYNSQWEQHYQELVLFKQTHGHCRVPSEYLKLASWIERQRTAKTNNRMPAYRIKQLDKINFIWNYNDIKNKGWEERYKQLYAFKQRYGHSFVPVNYKEDKALGIWVASQRLLEAKGKLGGVKKKKLTELGFVWSRDTERQLQIVYDIHWETSFDKLKDYKQLHGSCQVSLKIDPILQRWTRWQRMLFYQGKLSKQRIDMLNEIRFPWNIQEAYWMKMYDLLINYRNQFGHTRVPFQWEPNPQLASWVYRVKSKKHELTSQKIELLNHIGFDWTIRKKTLVPWKTMYHRLIEFKKKHGHTRVPVKWQEDPKLGRWVSKLRSEKDNLTPERISFLRAIEFDWGYQLKNAQVKV